MIIRIVNRSHHPLPAYATDFSAGMDLRAFLKTTVKVEPLQRLLIPTGLYIELPEGYEAQIRPRSGMALSKGLAVLNSPGTIDSDYRGEIKIIVANLSNESFEIADGERIAQMVISRFERAKWDQVTELQESARGEGGFGHSGVQ
ncbi:MAG TPA: dUTP diphosphatase [Bacteroidales bacterium]|nr:dUTP diphosphatase [Bacteroidales bacterium]